MTWRDQNSPGRRDSVVEGNCFDQQGEGDGGKLNLQRNIRSKIEIKLLTDIIIPPGEIPLWLGFPRSI